LLFDQFVEAFQSCGIVVDPGTVGKIFLGSRGIDGHENDRQNTARNF